MKFIALYYAHMVNLNRNALKNAYKWIEDNYPDHSQSMKYMKDQINDSYAHANILPTSDNILFESGKIGSLFFDKEDKLFATHHLWQVGNVCLGILDMYEKIIIAHRHTST